MKNKKEYLILGGIILALVLYLVFKNQDRSFYRLPEIAKIDTSEVSRIEISKKDGSIVLGKKEKQWHINEEGYPADTMSVESILETIGNLTVTVLVSESKNYELYDLGDDKKISVKAWAGEDLVREFEIGKTAPSYQHTFVKLKNDECVYHGKDSFRYTFDKTVDDLRDKTALSFDQGEIKEIELTKGKDHIVISRKATSVETGADQGNDEESKAASGKAEMIWQTADGKKIDEAKLKSLLATLSKLHLEKYIDGLNKEGLKDPIYSIQLKGTEEYALSVFAKRKKDEKEYPATSSVNAYPFMLSDEQIKSITKNPDDMFTAPKK